MDRAGPMTYDKEDEEEIGNFIYVAIGIAVTTVVLMYGWMGYTLYEGYLDDKEREKKKAEPKAE